MRIAPYLFSAVCGFAVMPITYAHEESHGHKHHEHHEQHQHEGHRHHGAHVHGMATLDLVMDGQELMLHLQSPLMNFLGFEHQPETEQQKAIYHDMLQQLEMLDVLLTVEGSTCKAESIEIDEPFDSQGQAGHADLDVSYFVRCEQPDNITGLKINLFDVYNRLETLQVQMVLPTGQQQLELNPQRTTIRIN